MKKQNVLTQESFCHCMDSNLNEYKKYLDSKGIVYA